MVEKTKPIRIPKKIITKLRDVDPVLAAIGSDSEVVRTALNLFLKDRGAKNE